jgi:hypothetical protein
LAGLLLISLLAALPLSAIQAQRAANNTSTTASARATAKASSAPVALSAATLEAAETITAARLKEHLYVVASDEMAGRNTPSPGLDATAKYIADKMAALKLKPGGDKGTYFQRIELESFKADPSKTSAEFQGRVLKYGDDFLTGNASGEAAGSLVYAGHGYVVKSKKVDAYRGLDVRGKIIVVSSGVLPEGVARGELKGKAGEGNWEDAASYARKNGAAGLVIIPRNLERVFRIARYLNNTGSDSFKPTRLEASATEGVPTLIPSAEIAKLLFDREQVTGEELIRNINARQPGAAFALDTNKRLSFKVTSNTKTATTQNVVALLEGSDSSLKKEYVAFGAHYDHVGVGRADKNGDKIYNGADDDGSGTVSLLALAEAFARGPRPKRSLLFIWHTGEEKGLWGSEYYTEYPTVPLKQIVAQFNIDMIGRSKQPGDTNPLNRDLSGANEIYVIGSREMSTELGDLSDRVNRSYLKLDFNYRYDDPADPNRFFYRSDHFNYARKGIPIIFYFDGEHEDYHKPSDSPDKIDYRKMERIVRTIFVTSSEVANAARRPLVDKPLSDERAEN